MAAEVAGCCGILTTLERPTSPLSELRRGVPVDHQMIAWANRDRGFRARVGRYVTGRAYR
ncbi:hypothetical protein SAMN05660657_05632 [Geodermatophilus amargosae]|uniref:Uncharacterized protein n=1 Tax=Geodermatophilus amargosae TaxID=1296565 RepID=A0A1I7DD23_9ACTN|nr:hypothetical protein [Geodermatophilus amargosae]SFU09588.1 hypothetical protein SAMN05660657_05632 [Geodermatophilus amargosae]